MIICFECGPRTKTLLDSLLSSGQYRDYSEVISLALDNLSVLQNELSSKGGALTLESENELMPLQTSSVTDHVPKRSDALPHSDKRDSKKTDLELEARLVAEGSATIPNLFLLDGIGELSLALASPPADVWTMKQEVPLERWIFGQYNKFLPAKVSCRALAHLLQDKPDGVRLEDAAFEISQEALTIGSLLARYDKQNGTKRDDALSTAFPSPDREVEKSRMRYANQFVASVTKKGKVSGLLMDLKLINHTDGNKPRLKLTEAGWSFAKLRNPILDNNPPETTNKFTADERAFLLDHISNSIPAEDFAYRAILAAVDAGARTPGELDAALQGYVSKDADQTLTKTFLATQRSGAVSRMADLELITRKRDGVRVSYVTTDLGQQYAEDKVVPLQRRKHFE
jgi:hypothetical protein